MTVMYVEVYMNYVSVKTACRKLNGSRLAGLKTLKMAKMETFGLTGLKELKMAKTKLLGVMFD